MQGANDDAVANVVLAPRYRQSAEYIALKGTGLES